MFFPYAFDMYLLHQAEILTDVHDSINMLLVKEMDLNKIVQKQ